MKNRSIQAAALLAALLPALPAAAQTYKFKTIDYSKKLNTILEGLSTTTITGDYFDANGNANCFLVTGSMKKTLSDPSGTTSACYDINKSGTVVGFYITGSGSDVGFSYTGTTFADVTGPKGSTFSAAYGVSDKGEIIGTYVDASGLQHGFLYNGKKYTSFDTAGSATTLGVGINDSGDYTVQALDANGGFHSYLVIGTKTTELIFPASTATRAHNISNKGLVALGWLDQAGNEHGGVYDSVKKTYTQIDVPNSVLTSVTGIDDKETLTGLFIATNGTLEEGFKATGSIK